MTAAQYHRRCLPASYSVSASRPQTKTGSPSTNLLCSPGESRANPLLHAANGAPHGAVCGFRPPAGVVARLPAIRGAVGASVRHWAFPSHYRLLPGLDFSAEHPPYTLIGCRKWTCSRKSRRTRRRQIRGKYVVKAW